MRVRLDVVDVVDVVAVDVVAVVVVAVVVVDAERVHLKGLTNLQGLVLPKQITDAGTADLRQALPNCKSYEVALSGCHTSCRGCGCRPHAWHQSLYWWRLDTPSGGAARARCRPLRSPNAQELAELIAAGPQLAEEVRAMCHTLPTTSGVRYHTYC